MPYGCDFLPCARDYAKRYKLGVFVYHEKNTFFVPLMTFLPVHLYACTLARYNGRFAHMQGHAYKMLERLAIEDVDRASQKTNVQAENVLKATKSVPFLKLDCELLVLALSRAQGSKSRYFPKSCCTCSTLSSLPL